MAESDKPLKFWMSGEIQNDVNDGHRKARKAIESQVNECIDKRDYGEGLILWSYLAIILNDDTDPHYPEVKKIQKEKKGG